MSGIRQQLAALAGECESLCEQEGWLGYETRIPNFRLIYSSVESFEHGSGFAIVGMNPAGDGRDAHTDDCDRPFQDPGYSAYLDDEWREHKVGKVGAARLQRVVQALAMLLVGASPSEAIAAIDDTKHTPEERINGSVLAFLRNTPSLNIIPFRHSNLGKVPPRLRKRGEEIGWQLLCLARPGLRCIVTLVNQVSHPPWRTILKNSGQPPRPDYEKKIHESMSRTYREAQLVHGPLAGTLLIGLPAMVRDKGRLDVTKPLFEVVRRRLRYHGML